MRTLILAFLLFFATFVSAQEEDCVNPQQPVYYQQGWVLVKKELKLFKHIEMWGASDHSPYEFLTAGPKFRYHWIETRKPKVRYIHEVLRGDLVIRCGSNDDTGHDHIRIMAAGEILLDKEFGDWDTFHLKVAFKEATTLVVMVYNTWTPKQSPGAFFVGINMKYYKQVYRRQRALISITL